MGGGGRESADEFQKTGKPFSEAASECGDTAFACPGSAGCSRPHAALLRLCLHTFKENQEHESANTELTGLRLPAIKSSKDPKGRSLSR